MEETIAVQLSLSAHLLGACAESFRLLQRHPPVPSARNGNFLGLVRTRGL